MRSPSGLPLPKDFRRSEEYVESLLEFVSSCKLLQLLCGGVHILDFFTRTPDLYAWLLDEEWREWFDLHDLQDILDFVLREDLEQLVCNGASTTTWRGAPLPPKSLVQYVRDVRRLSLNRDFVAQNRNGVDSSLEGEDTIPRHVAVGMKLKKIHEVDHFSRYIQQLTADITATQSRNVTHLVDFGSGQNYLGRTLASQPYNQHVIAVESKPHNITEANKLDILAKVAPKHGIWRNKKEYRAQLADYKSPRKPTATSNDQSESTEPQSIANGNGARLPSTAVRAKLDRARDGSGSVQYVEHRLEDWDLSAVIDEIVDDPVIEDFQAENTASGEQEHSLVVMSIHSCGNLSHHGIRSILNPSVKGVAIVGCCYNLVTERFTPPTYKHFNLRPESNPLARLYIRSSNSGDPHGFPMSDRISNYPVPLHLNITARMMAVQAPLNWGPEDSDSFFTRHFYRALLQKIFLDRGVIDPPSLTNGIEESYGDYVVDGRVTATDEAGGSTQHIVLGKLRKSCYASFAQYVRGALAKLFKDPARGVFFQEKLGDLSDEDILRYEKAYTSREKDLSVVWTLMAFSAVLVEAVIVVDRWLWLKEQKEVDDAWVETVFDYKWSPRNLVVVGIKN